jgi:hypothetical protein
LEASFAPQMMEMKAKTQAMVVRKELKAFKDV